MGLRTSLHLRQHLAEGSRRRRDGGVGRALVQVDLVLDGIDRPAAGKDDVIDIPLALIRCLWAEDPLVAASEHVRGINKVEQREPNPVDRASRGGVNPVIGTRGDRR